MATDLLRTILGREGELGCPATVPMTEGADVYQLAKDCRTSVEMIQKHYAVHIMGAIDTASVNARKSRQRPDDTHAV
jgi:hypothetical protein